MRDPREERSAIMRTFDVRATYTLSKRVSVLSDDYEIEALEDGSASVNTDKTRWEDAYTEDHYTVCELLEKLSEILKEKLHEIPYNSSKAIELRRMLSDCYGWSVDEYSYEEA